MGYEEFLARHLFGPAGMTHTGYVPPGLGIGPRSRSSTTNGADPRAGRSSIRGPRTAPAGTCAATAGMLSTARDMFRWYRALEGEEVLDGPAKRALFRPRVREGPHAESRYAYGWVGRGTPATARFEWHNGGNGWSYGEVVRIPAAHGFVFWATNQYRSRSGGWNLERLGARLLTGDVTRRLVAATRPDG